MGGCIVDTTLGDAQQQADAPPPCVRIFINYRHDDIPGDAQLLYERLARKFDRDNVFLDVRNTLPGMKWLEQIKTHIGSCHVFLSLIGPRWASIMMDRGRRNAVYAGEDHVRSEIQQALKPGSGIHLIPVLMGDDVSLSPDELPGPLQALADFEAAYVRHSTLDRDVESLVSRIEAITQAQRATSPESVTERMERGYLAPIPVGARSPVPLPDAAHYKDVLRQMVNGNLVPFLGARMTAGRASMVEGTPSLPDAEVLAGALAEESGIERTRLPEIAQHVYVTGRPDLYRVLRLLLKADYEPGPVHRFLARLPGLLEKLGLEKRYQLIVSTSFDRALEQAFRAEREPYDLAVYMASGRDQGKFVHFPYDGTPTPIDKPNSYLGLPIGIDWELERTVIVKIHGAVDDNVNNYSWSENYVITEDHYIDYLSKSPIESLVPVQVLAKLNDSHCLFLGYTVRDWSLRVFLKRIWEGRLGAGSWAVEPDPDVLEKKLWAESNVELYASDLGDYIKQLQAMLGRRRSESARP